MIIVIGVSASGYVMCGKLLVDVYVQTWTKVLGHFSQAHILPSYVVRRPIII